MLKLPQSFLKNLLTVFILVCLFSTFAFTVANADINDYRENCSTTNVSEDCLPPQISDIQVLVAKLLTSAYYLGGLAFFLILLYNGSIYLIGSWEESEYILGASIKDVQKRMAQWGTGFFMFFLSYPLMNTILGLLVANTNCYEALREPGFTFFFPTVCNEVEINEPVDAVETNIDEGQISYQWTCDEYKAATGYAKNLTTQCFLNCGLAYSTVSLFPLKDTTDYVYCDCANKSIANICVGITSIAR